MSSPFDLGFQGPALCECLCVCTRGLQSRCGVDMTLKDSSAILAMASDGPDWNPEWGKPLTGFLLTEEGSQVCTSKSCCNKYSRCAQVQP